MQLLKQLYFKWYEIVYRVQMKLKQNFASA